MYSKKSKELLEITIQYYEPTEVGINQGKTKLQHRELTTHRNHFETNYSAGL